MRRARPPKSSSTWSEGNYLKDPTSRSFHKKWRLLTVTYRNLKKVCLAKVKDCKACLIAQIKCWKNMKNRKSHYPWAKVAAIQAYGMSTIKIKKSMIS